MSKKYKFLHDFFKIIEELNIDYWLEGGTALSAHRDGAIFPWEHDFDIGILKKNLDNKLPILIKRISHIDSEIIVQKNFPFLDNIIQIYCNDKVSSPNQIDIYLYTEKNNNIYMRWFNSPLGFGSLVLKSILYFITDRLSKNHNNFFLKTKIYKVIFNFFLYINYKFYNSTYHAFPKIFFEKNKKISFCGLKLNIPFMIDEFLEYRYGKNWKIPDKSFNQMGKWKTSKARPILRQNFLPYPQIDYDIYNLTNYADQKNK